MIYGYARVSTRIQAAHGNSLDEQVEQLRGRGCAEIVSIDHVTNHVLIMFGVTH